MVVYLGVGVGSDILLSEALKVCEFQTQDILPCPRHLTQIIWQSAILRNCPCSWGAFLVLVLLYSLNKPQPWTFSFTEPWASAHTSHWNLYVPSKKHTSVHDAGTQHCYRGVWYLWLHFILARQAQGVILSLKGYCRGATEEKGVKNKAGYSAGTEMAFSTWVLTCLWGTAGQCREGQIDDIAADDRGL